MKRPRDDLRYRIPDKRFAPQEHVAQSYQESVVRTLDALATIPNRPTAMAAFDSLFREPWRPKELQDDPRPKVGYLCNFVPDEIVLAAGGIPLRLDAGTPTLANAGAQVVASGVCPEVRAIIGAEVAQLPIYKSADLLVVPTACDGKRKLVQTLGERRAVFPLMTPQGKRYGDRAWRERWYQQIRDLADAIRRVGGRRLRRGPLLKAINAVNERTALIRALYALRRETPGLLSGRDLFLVMQASFIADIAWWNDATETLLTELRDRTPDASQGASASKARILLTGAPVYFPSFQLLQVIEGAGAEIVGDDLCSGTQRLYHPAVLDETSVGGMLRAAADRTVMPNTCPCFTNGNDRLDQLLERIEQTGAQGVLHHSLRLCQLYEMELPRAMAMLKERGIPVLTLYTEESDQDEAILGNRVQAFLEMIDTYL